MVQAAVEAWSSLRTAFLFHGVTVSDFWKGADGKAAWSFDAIKVHGDEPYDGLLYEYGDEETDRFLQKSGLWR